MAAFKGVVRKKLKPNERPENEGLQLFDASQTLEEQ